MEECWHTNIYVQKVFIENYLNISDEENAVSGKF